MAYTKREMIMSFNFTNNNAELGMKFLTLTINRLLNWKK